jgi:hypothetical protein
MILTRLCVAADVHIRETTHIPGEENDRCDQLSRRGPNPTQSVDAHATAMGLPGVPVQLQRDANDMALLTLCDPAIEIDTDDLFTTFWTRARQIIDVLLTGHPLPPPTLPPSLLDLYPSPHVIVTSIQPPPHTYPTIPARTGDGPLSLEHQEDLAKFLGNSVLPGTRKTYQGHLRAWELFLKSQTTTRDILLKGYTDKDKASLICLFLRQALEGSSQQGSDRVPRGNQTAFRQESATHRIPRRGGYNHGQTSVPLKSRGAPRKKGRGASTSVKIPACEGMLVSMRTRLWEGQEWT